MGKFSQATKISDVFMFTRLNSTHPYLKKMTVTALAVWLSGVSFLFCCGEFALASAQDEHVGCSVETVDSIDNDNCCATQGDEKSNPKSTPCKDECCILKAPLAEIPIASKFEKIVAHNPHLSALKPISESSNTLCSSHKPHRLPDNQNTYLRCCTFLI